MKYGVLLHKKTNNIGDVIQSYAIEQLYEKLGISKDCIQYIALEDLADYHGDYIVLPINIYGGYEEVLNLSPYIIPLYLGYNNTLCLADKDVELLKKHEPIGCRDEYTLRNMREHGIESYLIGCFTLTLDKRKATPQNGKYYYVDVPDSIKDYIPDEISEKSIFMTHIITERDQYDEYEFYEYVINRYREYRDYAAVIVTGRLHCAAPCLAMGIPVIIVKQNIDVNLSWIDKYLPIYDEREFDKINWNPDAVDLEHIKMMMIELFQNRLNHIIEEKKLLFALSTHYEVRQKSKYNFRLVEKLNRITKKLNRDFSYVIWGVGPGGFLGYQIIKEYCPEASLQYAIDRYKKGNFYNVPIVHPEEINVTGIDYIFVCTYSGRIDAVETLEKHARVKNKDYAFLLSRVDAQDQYYDGYE